MSLESIGRTKDSWNFVIQNIEETTKPMFQHHRHHHTTLAILLLCTPCSYTAAPVAKRSPSPRFDLEESVLLREAVMTNNPTKVENALANRADPNFTPTPHSPSFMQQTLKLCWYTSKAEMQRACFLAVIAAIFEMGGMRQNAYLSPLQDALLCYLGLMLVRSALSNARNTTDHSPSLDKSPLLLATLHHDSYEQRNIVRMLLDAKADLHAADAQGNTALHYAMKHGLFITDLKQLFICAGADFDSHNNYGITPRDLMQEASDRAHNQSFFPYLNKSKQKVDDHVAYLTALLEPLPSLFNETQITRIIGDYCLPVPVEFYKHKLDGIEQWATAYRMHTDSGSPLAPAQKRHPNFDR